MPLLCHVSHADQLKLAHFLEMLERLPCGLVAGKSLMLVGIVVQNVFRPVKSRLSVRETSYSPTWAEFNDLPRLWFLAVSQKVS